MKNHFLRQSALLLLLFATGNGLWAQIPAGYYDNASGKQGDALKSALHNIIKSHNVVSYNGLLTAFAYTDCKANGKIWDIYSNYEYSLKGNCGTYDEEGDCWNREHTWPQSWFNEKSTPRSDLFHVYPTDGYVNGKRSNYPYGEVGKATYTSGNGSKLGPCVTAGYSGTVFEPIDEYKGDIARGFFYMSVRYAGEDSGWGTSGMTNKSTILPWAMEMLLRWSDQDPVSQKEIDRNNAVYGYQGNRNPFIDHPEYARMIWDENYTPTTSYAITCATGLSHGSVSAPESASQGSAVSITATPEAGYMVDTYTVYKTGSPATTVAVSSNGTFVMPDYAVTVSASFKVNSTMYDIALGTVSHGGISASPMSAKSGTTINLTATPNSGYSLYSWYVFKTGDMNTTVPVSGNSFVMPAYNVTVMATFTQGSGGSGNYEKVTTAPTDWSGEYLIVCESQNVAFNGTVDNKWGRCSSVTINNAVIESNATTDGYKVVVSQEGTGYKFKFPNNKYMSWTTAKTFAESITAVAYSITLDGGNANIAYGTVATMKYNDNSGSGGLRSYASGQTAIQLYKKTAATVPTHSIQFNNNGGSGTMNSQTVNENEPTALNPNDFTRENFVFDGWSTEADGSGTYYADEATVRLLADLTLYAQWDPLYSITISDDIAHGSVSANVALALEDQTVTLTATPDSGYELDHWVVMDENDNAIAVAENQFEMPASNVTVSAVFTYVGVFEQQYYLVTDASQLVAGRSYLIVNADNAKAMGRTQNSNNRSSTSVTIANETITDLAEACEFTLGGQTGAWTFYDATNNSGYLFAAGGTSNNNYLRTQTTLTDAGKWTISLNGSSIATIKTIDSNVNRHTIMYNSSSGLFSCYASGQKGVCLFVRSEQYEHNANTTLACLNTFDKHTVLSDVTMEAGKVLGMNMLSNPNYLILEPGAQFIHNTTGVQAMVKKTIEPFTADDNGWYFIASPVTENITPSTDNGLIANGYDLYYYDEPTHYWRNYVSHSNDFVIEHKKGYLYANNAITTLQFEGILAPSNAAVSITGLSHSAETLNGFNLVGNPFACNATVDQDCYVISGNQVVLADNAPTLAPCEGVMVKADSDQFAVTFTKASGARGNGKGKSLDLVVTQGKATLDRARVRLGEGTNMEKFNLDDEHTQISFWNNGQNFAVAYTDGQNELPLHFKAAKNGTYSIGIEHNSLDLDYLHLIDNMTGADIDLLQQTEYTFAAKTTDYASRFRLLFAPHCGDAVGDDGALAYVSNGEIVVVGDADTASLQVVDMTGRVVVSVGGHTRCVPTTGIPAGVYVLRLIDGDNVKTQKIVLN